MMRQSSPTKISRQATSETLSINNPEDNNFQELKKNLEALALTHKISLKPGENCISNKQLGEEFEPYVLQLLCYANQLDYIPAHQLLGILFERGLVCSNSAPGGNFLQMFGAIYHYNKFINSQDQAFLGKSLINETMVNQICSQVINNVTNIFKWHFHEGQKITYCFSLGIDYEKMAMKAVGIEARYLTSWALYYYDRSAGISHILPEKFGQEASYNAGMIFKNGKGLHYSNNDPDDKLSRITQAQFYFLQSQSYAPSLYELAQIEFSQSQEANTQLDSQKAFDQAFCWLTQAIYGCEFQFGPAYYLIADLWINGCFATETNKISIEDYEQILTIYEGAQKWYKKFDEPNLSVNRNIDLVKKIISMKNDKNKLEIIEKPYFGLFRSKMLKFILTKSLQSLISIILTQFIKEYSKLKNFSFMKNADKTKISMNNIAQSVIKWPFKIPLKTILRNFIDFNQKVEIGHETQSSPQICQSIKGILVDEDEKWTNVHVKEILKQIIPFTQDLIDNLPYLPMLDIPTEIVGLYQNCNEKKLISGDIKQQISAYFADVQKESTQQILNKCENTFKILKYWERLKLFQSNIYEAIEIIQTEISNNVEKELDFLFIVKDLIQSKLKLDEYLYNNSDALNDQLKLQIQSAKGIYDYKKETKLESYQEAKEQLDAFCKTILKKQQQIDLIGYDILRNIKFVEELKEQSFTQIFAINDNQRNMKLCSKNLLEIENNWWDNNTLIKKAFQKDNISLNLKDIQQYSIDRMNQFQAELQKSNDKNEPILNYESIYNDPIIHFACKEIRGQIEQFEADATKQLLSLHQDQELKQYFNNGIYQILLEKVNVILAEIRHKLVPTFEIRIEVNSNKLNVNQIIKELQNFANNFGAKFSIEDMISPISIQMMKYFLFFLDKIAKQIEPCESAVYQLVIGLYGRCPDGQMLFFIQLLNQHCLNSNELQNSQINGINQKTIFENYQMNLTVSLFFQQLKLFFIEQHLTRDQNAHEIFTSLNLYLQLILQLPFDITGSFTKLAYPVYSLNGKIDDLATIICIKGLMDRFLQGGEVTYLDPIHLNKINAFTLKYVVQSFRKSLLAPDVQFNQKNVKLDKGLISEHQFSFGIQHNILEKYILSNKDLALEYLEMNNVIDKNLDSRYFKGSNATEGFNFKNILTDAGILFILSQLGYVKADEKFFQDVQPNWQLK